jgi:hypothetical protein
VKLRQTIICNRILLIGASVLLSHAPVTATDRISSLRKYFLIIKDVIRSCLPWYSEHRFRERSVFSLGVNVLAGVFIRVKRASG